MWGRTHAGYCMPKRFKSRLLVAVQNLYLWVVNEACICYELGRCWVVTVMKKVEPVMLVISFCFHVAIILTSFPLFLMSLSCVLILPFRFYTYILTMISIDTATTNTSIISNIIITIITQYNFHHYHNNNILLKLRNFDPVILTIIPQLSIPAPFISLLHFNVREILF